jgi:hypothetical protein
VSAPDPRDVLREARLLAKSQQYAAALEKYIWFHDHALDSDRSLVGVRLSYAIAEWVDLGKAYPPAQRALEGIRDVKTKTLMQGTYDADLFHDVAAINRALGQPERTSELFKSIDAAERSVAEKCFHIALEYLVATREFGFARSFISDPKKEIDRFATLFSILGRQPAPSVSPEMLEETLVRIYVKKVSLILRVFVEVGEEDVASRLRHYALECVPDVRLRDRIAEQLYSSRPSTGIQ